MTIEPLFKALSDLTRLRIMRLLLTMELAVGELADVLGQSQPRVSRHVAILCDAGLAARRREGSWVFLHHLLADRAANELPRLIAQLITAAEAADQDFAQIAKADREHLARIRTAREERAAEYFAGIAPEWDSMRAMLAPAQRVEAALMAALEAARPLGPGSNAAKPLGDVLDIGTGTGRIAELLYPQAQQVVALDKSPEMLRLARARLQTLPADKMTLLQGDFTALPFTEARFDTVIFHQVLHYAQQPSYALGEAARIMRPGAVLAIVDLDAHEHEELRRSHAHVRLGFSQRQMEMMLHEQGFALQDETSLQGSKLTVKIWIATRMPASAAATPRPLRPAASSHPITTTTPASAADTSAHTQMGQRAPKAKTS